ncbi:MAG: DUF427 domain-containing protein [Myxococcota bacterium]
MPDHFATIRAATRPYRVFFGDELLLETDQVLELEEHFKDRTFPAVPYFAPEATRGLVLQTTDQESTCPLKGQATYSSFRDAENAVWSYRNPNPAVEAIRDHVGFDTNRGFRVERVD